MEQFKDELAFLASDDVQNAGKRCGIVRVRVGHFKVVV
jgi:hypothetical protein